jgi:SSS family solute:Na+ symporter
MLAELTLPPIAKGLFYIGLLATVMSTLSSLSLIGGITVGKDIVGRLRSLSDEKLRLWSNIGIMLTAGLAIVLALAIPSVVGIWYTVGTCIVPGLLVPVVSSYFERLRIESRFALAAMMGGWIISSASLIWGHLNTLGGTPRYVFGIEPMVPGLLCTLLVWTAGKLSRRK